MQQFAPISPKLTLPLYEQDTAPRQHAISDADIIYALKAEQQRYAVPTRSFSFLEWIAIFFISTGLLFLASTMAVLFWKLFLVVVHT